ncbi:uncharacterized protein MICPUCDRAFT_53542 [Micromonas pusilla CCMP1545]|uniref:Sm protein B n=1 Tax=Micromonas pusilla (strain CCMP1545) TaxID=564608 RepID=C1N737_MICPC|nr:uncharacterized protein MICPUCDRAFT_53542 [Micromonas pusilla CCMP1545]EEH52206.1 predicted protein [Micromonas pusilla CCMP1545]|eukprot:XP_003063833.1 predicted protein [Micromonas pusilla CCMP1545]
MVVSRTSKMLAYINYRMRVTIVDGRQIVGRFMAFDRHMNIVLGDAEEFRKLPPKKGLTEEERQVRRVLGFLLLRGEEVVSLTVEGPPPQEDKRAQAQQAPPGVGIGKAAGRGMPGVVPGTVPGAPPPGLAGPVRGVGGAMGAHMMPQFSAPPMAGGMPPGMPPPGFRPGMPPPGMPPPGFRPGMPPPGMPPPGFRPGPPGPPPP